MTPMQNSKTPELVLGIITIIMDSKLLMHQTGAALTVNGSTS